MYKQGQTANLLAAMRRRGVERPEAFLAAFAAVATEALAAGEEVILRHFGALAVHAYPARPGHNPRTGAPVSIPAHRQVRFRQSQVLREALNGRKRGGGFGRG